MSAVAHRRVFDTRHCVSVFVVVLVVVADISDISIFVFAH